MDKEKISSNISALVDELLDTYTLREIGDKCRVSHVRIWRAQQDASVLAEYALLLERLRELSELSTQDFWARILQE
jgi:hypothetical protein